MGVSCTSHLLFPYSNTFMIIFFPIMYLYLANIKQAFTSSISNVCLKNKSILIYFLSNKRYIKSVVSNMYNIDFLNYRNFLCVNTNANLNINHKSHLNTNTIIIAKRHNKNYKTIIIPICISVDSL